MKLDFRHIAKDAGRFVTEQSPQILTILGVAGTGLTVYLAGKASWKAAEKVQHEEIVARVSTGNDNFRFDSKTKMEKVWKLYIPAAGTGVMTVFCIVAANRVQARRFAALAAAYGVLSGDFDEFRDKAAEKLGLKKADEVRTDIAKSHIEGNLPANAILGDGKSWFCDKASKRIYPSTMETIKAGMNKVNFQCNNQKDATLNDFYDAIGWEQTDVGDILGWNSSKLCDIEFSAHLSDTHGAVTMFEFVSGPFPNY